MTRLSIFDWADRVRDYAWNIWMLLYLIFTSASVSVQV